MTDLSDYFSPRHIFHGRFPNPLHDVINAQRRILGDPGYMPSDPVLRLRISAEDQAYAGRNGGGPECPHCGARTSVSVPNSVGGLRECVHEPDVEETGCSRLFWMRFVADPGELAIEAISDEDAERLVRRLPSRAVAR